MEDSQLTVMCEGHEIWGAVSSTMVINCVPLIILLQASFADHVLTIVPVPLQPVSPNTLSEKLMVISSAGVQLSVAVAMPV